MSTRRATVPARTIQLPGDAIGPEPPGWLAQLFHENTKITPACRPEVDGRIAAAADDAEYLRPAPVTLPGVPRVPLPRSRGWRGLDRLIRQRRTIRSLAPRPMPLRQLGRILSNAGGVSQWPTGAGDGPSWPLRSTPSAGALYAINVRVAALRVDGLERGIYRYHPYDHCLERTASHMPVEQLAQASLHPDVVQAAATVLALCAAWDRLVAKYGDRGYRYALLEAGHMAQNILLTCTALRRAAVPIGGFLDDACASALGAASPPGGVVYLIAIGRAG